MALPEMRVRVGADTAAAEAGLDRVEQGIRDVGNQSTRAALKTRGLTSGLSRIASPGITRGIQNAAFQIGDFAVQVGAGQRASVALAQQLPQLAGGFGVIGAVAGAAVAVVVPLAAAFLTARDNANELADALDEVSESTQKANDATRVLLLGLSSVSELRVYDRIQELTEEITAEQERAAQIEENRRSGYRRDLKNIRDRISALTEERASLQGSLSELRRANAERERAIENANDLAEIERVVSQAIANSAQEAQTLAYNMQAARDAAMDAAREFTTMQDIRSRFAGEEAVMGQDVLQTGRGEAPPELREEEESSPLQRLTGISFEAVDSELTDLEERIADHEKLVSDLVKGGTSDRLGAQQRYWKELAVATNSGSQRLLAIAKSFGAAQALIDAWQAHNAVLRDPLLPWWQRAAAAASVLATGIGAVNAIKGVVAGSDGAGATAPGGGGSAVAAAAPPESGGGRSTTFNVQLVGSQFGQDSIRDLIGAINREIEDGAELGGIRLV